MQSDILRKKGIECSKDVTTNHPKVEPLVSDGEGSSFTSTSQ